MALSVSGGVVLAFVLVLFAIAAIAERRKAALASHPRLRLVAYTLALGVYCSSWTFYGAVGTAAREGWNYLPIYAAPILLLIAAPTFLRRLTEAVAEEKAATVSDFIASRFSHDIVVARLVTLVALLGSVPYIALQLRSIGSAISIVSGSAVTVPVMITAAMLLAVFGVLFGARQYELAGRSEGLVYAIGADSLFKLLALGAVAVLAAVLLAEGGAEVTRLARSAAAELASPANFSLEFVVISLVSATAIVALPRQFYMGLVEARDPRDLVKVRFGLAGYIALMAVMVLPIAFAGAAILPPQMAADWYVLQIPAQAGSSWVLAAALLGGVSAAASMAVVDATALATMVSNDLVFPTLSQGQMARRPGAMGRRMLRVRRAAIFGIMALSLIWALLVSPSDSLASIGLIAFAAMAQFTPHLVLATYGAGRDHVAARSSLIAGLVLWAYTLALPSVLPRPLLDVLAGTPIDPFRLLGLGHASPLVHGVLWSLGCNVAIYAAVAARRLDSPVLPRLRRSGRNISDLEELAQLTASFVGDEAASDIFADARRGQPIDARAARRAQEAIARVIGVSSARTLITSALAGGTMRLPEVARLLDDGARSLRLSRQLLAATFENIDCGISVVDADMNLVAWNSRYESIFDYPPGLLRVGVPIADLIRHNALRGDFGEGDLEAHVQKRLEQLRLGRDHVFERRRPDGRVLRTVGGPMPDGGYVTTFTDITEDARVREELRRTRDNLEQLVAERTSELSDANRKLAEAARDKTRFLAAASHDLLQPLHAARLFAAALEREIPKESLSLVQRVESSLSAAEDLLRALLDISKLDAGGVQAKPEVLAVAPFLDDLVESFRPSARAKGLHLRRGPAFGNLYTDGGLLRSIIQNFIANAIRYSESGGVVVGVRRRHGLLRIDVVDTGVGIAPEKIGEIFGEFTRLGTVEVEGLGLGLALSERLARLLGGTITVRSTPGKGSRFSLSLPEDRQGVANKSQKRPFIPDPGGDRPRLKVLVVDNDQRILEASKALIDRLGHDAAVAASIAEALSSSRYVDAVLADYRLDNGEDGLTLLAAIRDERPDVPAIIISAEDGEELRKQAARLGVRVLAKPASAKDIEDFLASVSVKQVKP